MWLECGRHEPTLIKEIVQYISDGLINKSSKDVEAMQGQAKERISVLNIPTSPSIVERGEFPLRSKMKINRVKEIEIGRSRDAKAMEVYSHLEITELPFRLLFGKRRESDRSRSLKGK